MSKKMLKRSLALGALMAFVITGSAWAEEINQLTGNWTEKKGTGGDLTITDNSGSETSAAVMGSGTISGFDNLLIKAGNSNAVGSAGTGDGSITINANNIILDAKDAKKNAGTFNGNAITAHADVKIVATGDLTLLGNNRIVRVAAGETTLNATNIYINANEGGIATNKLNDDGAIKVDDGSTLNVGNENTKNIILNAKNDSVASGFTGISALKGGKIKINGEFVKISAESTGKEVTAIKVNNPSGTRVGESNITIGSSDTKTIDITAKSTAGDAYGLWATKTSGDELAPATTIKVEGNTLNINVEGKQDIINNSKYSPIGIWAASNDNATEEDKTAKIDINTANTSIIVKSTDNTNEATAIQAMSKGIININKGNVYAKADEGNGNVILARGGAVVNVGATGKETVLKGNISFNYNASTSGSGIDANVNAVLDGAKSSFTGKIYRSSDTTTFPDGADVVTGMNLSLSNGAKWNVTDDSFVNVLAGTKGFINKTEDAPEPVTVTIYNHGDNNIHDGEGIYSGVALTNNDLTIGEGVNLVVDTYETSIYNNNVKINSLGDVTIKSKHDDGICVYGDVVIDAKNVSVEANDNGIKVADADKDDNNDNGNQRLENGNVTINATGDVSVKSLNEGYAITNVSENKGRVEIKANGHVELASPDRSAVRVGETYDGRTFNGVVNVTGKSIAIEGVARMHDEGEFEPSAAYAKGAGELNLTATDNIEIADNGELVNGSAIGAFDGGTVNIQGAANVVAKGNVFASGEGSVINFANTGGVTVTGKVNVQGAALNVASATTVGGAYFDKDSTLNIKGAAFVEKTGAYVLNGVGNDAKLTVENGAKLTVTGIDYNTYNIAKDFATISKDKWQVNDLNTLMEGKWVEDTENKTLQLEVVAKKAEQIAEDLGVSETTGDFLNSIVEDAKESGVDVSEGTAGGKLVGLANAASKSNNDVVKAKAAAQAAEAVQKMAEAGGNSATAAKVVTNVTGVTNQRLSLNNGNHGGNKGGHGVGLLEEGSGAAIWAQYVHGKDSVEDMPSDAGASSYEGQYNGIVMGVDFKKVGKFQSGIAFNYGEGDTNSVNTTSPTRSEYDFWGIGYYGNIRNADSNVIFDIGYAKTDSDVTSNVIAEGYAETFEASPETTTWTAGVKVEKLYQNNNVQIVPYTGLRYMSIDPDDYSTKCGALSYNLERQDIWLLPVGVSIRQEVVNNNGWVVTPKVDLSYIWAFGDTDSSMETNTVFGSDNRPIGYDVMDDGSWMGLVGVEAAMDDWTFGVSYSYQKGDHSESKKWYVDAKYSF